MTAGRPSKYDETMVQKAYEYISECIDQWKHKKLKVKLPTKEGLALHLGIACSTVDEWAKKHEEFSGALGVIKEKQKENLIKGGLSGDYNPTITKLLLSANHGMRDGIDLTTDGKEFKGVQVYLPQENEE